MSQIRILMHAANISGLGATVLCYSLFNAINEIRHKIRFTFQLPDSAAGRMLGSAVSQPSKVNYIQSKLPNSLRRFFECIFKLKPISEFDAILVMGDIPLITSIKQIVYVHQPHIVCPSVDNFSSNSIKYKILRYIFSRNIKYANAIIVQTFVMKDNLDKSYPGLGLKTFVLGVPPSLDYINYRSINSGASKKFSNKLKLFYPAGAYPHKNHRILKELSNTQLIAAGIDKIYITVDKSQQDEYNKSYIECVGRLTEKECFEYYKKCDALLFLSSAESYGIPLVEAMYMGLYIICPDLPYSRAICGADAHYFNLGSLDSLCTSISIVSSNVRSGNMPDWSQRLKLIPENWDFVLSKILNLILNK